jgi:hypothetical protein
MMGFGVTVTLICGTCGLDVKYSAPTRVVPMLMAKPPS